MPSNTTASQSTLLQHARENTMQHMQADLKRTHSCGELRDEHTGSEVRLLGWVHGCRNLGGCVFVDLRDREGITQIVFDPNNDAALHGLAQDLHFEWVIGIKGTVRSRGSNSNKNLATGAIEVLATKLVVFSKAKALPFLIEDHVESLEETRLKHRFLDLRRPVLQENLFKRHHFNRIVREVLTQEGFWELETPFLIKSTPEGARDYVVPSRIHAGKFFALPQSPQLFKQLLMVAGYDRYFQIVRCFRDEDLRAERQPEFTQVDVEMSFCTPEDVQSLTEKILVRVWKELNGTELSQPFLKLTYADAMERYGSDAPDIRFGLEIKNCTDIFGSSEFRLFAQTVEQGGAIKGFCISEAGDWSRKDLDQLAEVVKTYGAKGLAWFRHKEDGTWQGPLAKLGKQEQQQVSQRLGTEPGQVGVLVADTPDVVCASLGNLRKHIAKTRNLVAPYAYQFCWVTDFPLLVFDDEEKRFVAAHHPFTCPNPKDIDKLDHDPASVRSRAYDIVLNGVEIGGGSIRIHDVDLQKQVFSVLGMEASEYEQKFGFLLDALEYGAPPHGGIALGVDRIMMLLCQTESIRDVIAFPKTQRQTDLMLDAPSKLTLEQLEELSVKVVSKNVTP